MMKMHAYFREKVVLGTKRLQDMAKFIPEWAKKKGITEKDLDTPEISIGTFLEEVHRFVYFHFAPTLVYRDTYVRSKSVRI